MTPDSLAELRRQRALVKQHLDWLDAEIAAHANESTDQPILPIPQPAGAPREDMAVPDPENPAYKPDPHSAGANAKLGCLILFFAMVALGILILVGIYFWKYQDRPLLFPDDAAQISDSRQFTL